MSASCDNDRTHCHATAVEKLHNVDQVHRVVLHLMDHGRLPANDCQPQNCVPAAPFCLRSSGCRIAVSAALK